MSTKTYFNGEQISIPGAYSAIDTTLMQSKGTGDGAKVIALIGESDGGEPNTVQFFTEPLQARKVLKGGDLLRACEKAWNPVSKTKQGVALGGANMIACIRTNQATKSVLEIMPVKSAVKKSKIAVVPDSSQTYLEKSIGDMIMDDAFIAEDGSVRGTLKYVKNFSKFNESVPAEQNGYYMPIKLTGVTGEKMDIIKNGEQADSKMDIPFDAELLFRVEESTDTFEVRVDGKHIMTFSFKKANLGEDSVATVIPQVRFESKDWGADTAHQIKISRGTIEGTKKVTIYDQTTGTYETFNNVGNLFSLAYTGTAKYCVMNVYKDPVTDIMWLVTKIGNSVDDAEEDIRIKLDPALYKSIRALIQQIQSYENYSVNSTARYNQKIRVNELDFLSNISLIAKTGEEAPRVTAVYADLMSTVNRNSLYVNVTAANREYGEIENIPYTSLEGGKVGQTPASWINFFDMLSNFDVYYIVPLTGDVSVHAELASHVEQMSGTLGKERRGIVGGENYESIAETVQRAHDLQQARMQVVHGGMYDYLNGEITLFPPYILAAQHAGRAAFLEDGESATHDTYRMVAPEYQIERSEITQLLDAGALAFEYVLGRNGSQQSFVRLVHDLTTDVTSSDTVHTERATGALADSINMEIRDKLDDMLTGKRISQTDMESAKNAVITILMFRQKKNQITAYKDVYLTKNGTITTVHYSVAPAEPNNFTLITAHFYAEPIVASGN